ncbi:MAG: hypothetical protein R3Y28_02615 [Candidatus Gastranaerophilales bacterium]
MNKNEFVLTITEEDKTQAITVVAEFNDEQTKNRAFTNTLAARIATKYLQNKDIDTSNIQSIYSVKKILETTDISDIILDNIHIDVRVIYDENEIFIPKSHDKLKISPDIYLVLKESENKKEMTFIGFFEPKAIDKSQQNDEYFFIEKEKLNSPQELKSFIEKFNKKNSKQKLSDDNKSYYEKIIVSLQDDNINVIDKKHLLQKLCKNSELRKLVNEYQNFENMTMIATTNNSIDNINIEIEANLMIEDDLSILENPNNSEMQTSATTTTLDDLEFEEQASEQSSELEYETQIDEVSNAIDDLEFEELTSGQNSTQEYEDQIEKISKAIDDLELEELAFEQNSELEYETQIDELSNAIDNLELEELTPEVNSIEDKKAKIDEVAAALDDLIYQEQIFEINLIPENIKTSETETAPNDSTTAEQASEINSEVATENENPNDFNNDTLNFSNSDLSTLEYLATLERQSEIEEDEASNAKEIDTEIQNNEVVFETSIEENDLNVLYRKANDLENIQKIVETEEKFPGKALTKNTKKPIKMNKKTIIYVATLLAITLPAISLALIKQKNNSNGNNNLKSSTVNNKEIKTTNTNDDLLSNSPDIKNIEVEKAENNNTDDTQSDTKEVINLEGAQDSESLTPITPDYYLSVDKLVWDVPEYLSYSNKMKNYLITIGKSIKMSLSTDLLLANDYAYSNSIKVSLTFKQNGTLQSVNALTSSGSAEIDEIVLQSVKQTAEVIKPPSEEIKNETCNLNLTIYF